MTTKEKKEYAILTVLLLATFAVIYFNFLKPKPAPAVHVLALPGASGPSAGTVPGATPAAGAGASVLALPGAAATPGAAVPGAISGGASNGFLPNGTELHTDVLNSKPFSTFIEPNYPAVSKDEIGSDNIFGN